MNNSQQINYTTKPIELPLSTEKEYVLVDKKGYSLQTGITFDFVLNPFKLSLVDEEVNGGWCSSSFVISADEIGCFREVIRQPQTNEFNTDSIAVTEQEEEEFNAMANNSEIPNSSEWKNGDECIWRQNGKRFKFVGMHCNNKLIAVVWNGGNDYRHCNIDDLRKPETPEQREERERLEAAYDLYCIYKNEIDMPKMSFNSFICAEQKNMNAWLAVIDKTNYRLTK